jgi:ribose transport system permease protein
MTAQPATGRLGVGFAHAAAGLRRYGVLVLLVALFVALSIGSDAFMSPRNLLNILNQNAPLAIMAMAGTLVIISGGFDLSTGGIFGVASVTAAWLAVNVDQTLGLVVGPLVGLALGTINGGIITGLRVHSFLATLATSLVYRGLAVLITGGFLIAIEDDAVFAVLGRGRAGPLNITVIVLVVVFALLTYLLTRTTAGRYVFAVGGNEEAAILSGIRTARYKILAFALSGLAAGIAGTIAVSRISSGQPQAGAGLELQAIAAVILGGTSIYGGEGAVWRSLAGVMLLALINNGFNILNANPFYKDLTTGAIIVLAVALAAGRGRR